MPALTHNYRFVLPDYGSTGWDTDEHNNLIAIDSLIGQFNVGINLQGLWKNSNVYAPGMSVIDGLTGSIYACGVGHTSITSPGLFATDRATHPTYWTDITNPAITAQNSAIAAANSATAAAASAATSTTQAGNASASATSAGTSATNAAASAGAAATSASSAATSLANQTILSTFRNRFINGALEINQRGAASYVATSTSTIYTYDRWIIRPTSFTATLTPSTSTTRGSRKHAAITGTVPAAGIILFGQRIEAANAFDLVGKQVTVSFYCDYTLTAGTMTFTASLFYANAADNFTAETLIQSITFIPTGTPGLYTATFSALPANAANGIEFGIIGTQSGATGVLTLNIGTLSLEAGTAANAFERRPTGLELALCQRYYERINRSAGAFVGSGSYTFNTSGIPSSGLPAIDFVRIEWMTSKRVNPTAGGSAANQFTIIGFTGNTVSYTGDLSSFIIVNITAGAGSLVDSLACLNLMVGASPVFFEGNAEL